MKALAICSGGLDSTILYHYLKTGGSEVKPVNFYYGSKHNDRERQAARKLFGDDLYEIDINLSAFNSALLKSNPEDVPDGHYEDESMKRTVVPFRNGIMLAYAAGLAESWGYDYIAIGNHAGDHAIYPDCRSQFIESISAAIFIGTYKNIKVLAPFSNITKTEIVKLSVGMKLDPELLATTWSCYKGGEIHCGTCGTCTERIEAIADGDADDFTQYLVEPKQRYQSVDMSQLQQQYGK